VIVLGLAAGSTGRIGHDVSVQWHAFVRLAEPADSRAPASATASSRLLTGAGNRYDYWRIAWNAWRRHPLLGLGAGNYARTYYERRATIEAVDQPHSLELQALSDLGLGGALLLGCFLAGVFWGAVRMNRRAAASPLRLALLTGGLGVFTAWLVQASVDWMHLLPGLTAIALAAAATLIWPRSLPAQRAVPSSAARPGPRQAAIALGVSAVIVAVIATGASLSRQGLAEVFRSNAQGELHHNPAAALTDANRSLNFDADAVGTYYVKAAALARFDQPAAAEVALARALAREPGNFVTWALLGDIAVRQGNLRAAANDYRRAHRLNPRDPILAALARDPRAALR
jgi:tetratricopeptide (TPR) repeat protein